jgi:hypothetical protein
MGRKIEDTSPSGGNKLLQNQARTGPHDASETSLDLGDRSKNRNNKDLVLDDDRDDHDGISAGEDDDDEGSGKFDGFA